VVFSGFAAHFLSLWGSASLSFAPTSADLGGLEDINLRGRCFNGNMPTPDPPAGVCRAFVFS
jgi:hypothetical protein